MIYSIEPLTQFTITSASAILNGRNHDDGVRIVRAIVDAPPRTVFVFDCSYVAVMDYSYANEFVYAAICALGDCALSQKFFMVKSACNSVWENIDAALLAKSVACVITGQGANGRLDIAGALSPALRDTFRFMVDRDATTTADLPSNLSPSTRSNRLRDLESAGLIYLTATEFIKAGGRRFAYKVVGS